MIRVNLLPNKRGPRGEGRGPQASQRWLLVVLGVLVLEVVGLFIFHRSKLDELDAQKATNTKLQGEIRSIENLVSSHEEIKKILVNLRAREDAILKLQNARSGPTAVLLEVAQILTPKGPTADRDRLAQLSKDNPLAVYNKGWDSHRLWLQSYIEGERVVRIEGLARDGADVSELAQRLKLSTYFYDVVLLQGKKEPEKDVKIEMVQFALQLKVRY